MNQGYDLIAIAALMLSTMLAVWFSLAGAPNLKDWQPLIAAIIAFGGGALAYKGAMAKINFNREVREEEALRRRLALALRLRYAVSQFKNDASVLLDKITPKQFDFDKRTTSVQDLRLQTPQEFNEGWAALELLPRDATFAVTSVRVGLRLLELEFSACRDDRFWTYSSVDAPTEIRDLTIRCDIMKGDCERLLKALSTEIDPLRR